VTRSPPFKSYSVALPIVLLVVAMASFQLGAVVAKQLFVVVGVAGATALRLGLSSVILLAVWRPWRVRLNLSEAGSIGIYGLAMGLMNLFFYSSLDRIPLGIAVALEFTGPLAVAMAASRRPIDFVWIALAAFGLIAILPLGTGSQRLDPVGIGFALAAGLCWAIYIVFGQKAGNAHGGQTTALGTVVGAIVIVPIGIGHAGAALLSPALLPAAVFARNVRVDALAHPDVWSPDERRSGAGCTVGPDFFGRKVERRPVGGNRQHHVRLGGQRPDLSQRAAAGATRLGKSRGIGHPRPAASSRW
jgi:threonine/homoserine efflux transporter RhtA